MLTVLLPKFTATIPRWPSTLKSPTATPIGSEPTANVACGWKLVAHRHAPDEQVDPLGHNRSVSILSEFWHLMRQKRLKAVPHAPQLLLSVWRLTHAPLQRDSPLVVHIQAPKEHVWLVAHYIQSETRHFACREDLPPCRMRHN
jgi:hypothetical protein